MTIRPIVRAAVMFCALGIVGCGSAATSPTSPSTAGPEEWFGVIAPGGTGSRSFTAAASGTVTATLLASSAPLSIGVGVPGPGGGGCRLTASIEPDAGSPVVSAPVEQGTYCVEVYDAAIAPEPISFSVTIAHP